LKVRKGEDEYEEEDNASGDDNGGFVTPFDFATFPNCAEKTKDTIGCASGQKKETSLGGSDGPESTNIRACSATTVSVQNGRHSDKFGHKSADQLNTNLKEKSRQRIPPSNCQAKVDLFKRKLEKASKYSIVGKDIVRKNSQEDDDKLASPQEASKRSESKTVDRPEQGQMRAKIEKMLELKPVSGEYEKDEDENDKESSDGSELIGDKYIDIDIDQFKLQEKIKIVKADIANVRSRLQKKQQQPRSPKKDAHTDIGTIKSESFSLPTCFSPRSAGYRAEDLIKQVLDSPNFPSLDASPLPMNLKKSGKPARTSRHQREIEIIQAAERAERKVREGLEKMKQGLADNKKVKLSLEKLRKNKVTSPSPRKEPRQTTNMLDSFNHMLPSWLKY